MIILIILSVVLWRLRTVRLYNAIIASHHAAERTVAASILHQTHDILALRGRRTQIDHRRLPTLRRYREVKIRDISDHPIVL